jgi:hypothetical protein
VEDRTIYRGQSEVGHCPCGARLRPHIVFFGETPLEMDRIQQESDQGADPALAAALSWKHCLIGLLIRTREIIAKFFHRHNR